MTSAIKKPRDFLAGISYPVFGNATVLLGSEYGLASDTRMVPGYFPGLLGSLLVVIGIASLIWPTRAFRRHRLCYRLSTAASWHPVAG